MRSKMILFGVILFAVGAFLLWERPEEPKPKSMPEGHPQIEAMHNHGELPTIETAVIEIQDIKGDKIGPLELKPGELMPLKGKDYSVRVTDFYTHWNFDDGPINRSMQEANPAIKVEIVKNDEVLTYGWAFKNMPFFRMNQPAEDASEIEGYAYTLVSYQGLKTQ